MRTTLSFVCFFYTRDSVSSFFVELRLRLQPLKIPESDSELRLQVKVGHWVLNLYDCDSVLSERYRQTNSQDFFKNNNNMGLLFLKQVKTGTAYVESFWQDSDSDSASPF